MQEPMRVDAFCNTYGIKNAYIAPMEGLSLAFQFLD